MVYIVAGVPCRRCNRQFDDVEAWEKHKADSPNHHFCRRCRQDFDTHEQFSRHLSKYHRCPFCTQLDFDTVSHLLQHIKVNHPACQKCGFMFSRQAGLLEHYRTSEEHYYCEPCGKDFDDVDLLQKHDRYFHAAYCCKNCDDTFDDENEYENHREYVHYCAWCRRYFDDLEDHFDESHYRCDFTSCGTAVFKNKNELINHWRTSEYHNWCHICERHLPSDASLSRHKKQSHGLSYCYGCNEEFKNETGLKEHYVQSPRHAFCQYCVEHFRNLAELEVHFKNEHSYCSLCRKVFKNGYGLKEHYRQSEAHHYCPACDRHFMSANNLQNHLLSSQHRPKIYACPFAGCCIQTFVSQSAVVLHLESGACRSGADRAAVDREVRRLDKNNIITDPSRLLTGSNSSVTTYIANENCWNGYAYQCYLCHRNYRTLHALNQHLASPNHQEKIYICPLSTCRTKFTTLSALWQHVESEKCGIARFEQVKATLDGIMGKMALLQF